MWNPDGFLTSLYENASSNQEKWSNTKEYKGKLKQQLRDALGHFSLGKTQFSVEVIERVEFEEYVRERVTFQLSEELQIPIYILTPSQETTKYPAVLALHGHGYGSREIVGLCSDGTEDKNPPGIHQHFAVELVKRGMKVFAPEVIGFGDRILEQDKKKGKPSSCTKLSSHLLMYGKTLAGLRVEEAIRTLDLIMSFKDVNRDRVGIMGFSGGGLIAAFTSALDERIHSTVICGFTNTFKGSILQVDHCIDNYVPGIMNIAELPELMGLIAPRRLFVESGRKDYLFPVEHVKDAVSRLERIFGMQHAKDNFEFDIFEGEHSISGRYSYDWLKDALSIVGEAKV